MYRWSLHIRIGWTAPRESGDEQWWKLWKQSTGERMERIIEIDDMVFYMLVCIFWALANVAR